MTKRGEPDESARLNRAVKKGAAWVGFERAMIQVLNLVSSIILARLLEPGDFGVLGMALFFTGLSSRLVQFGFGAAAVRLREFRPDHSSTLFSLSLAVNTVVMAILMAMAPLAGAYFKNPLVTDVLRVMSLNFVIRCIGTCPMVLLRRQMNFRATTISSFMDYGTRLAVTIGFALSGYGVWSLVFGELAGGLSDKFYLAYASGWRPGLRVTRPALKDLWAFGLNMSLKQTLIYFSENVDNLVVGRVLGAAPLGFYEKSYRLMNLPVSELSSRLGQVLFPAYARIQDDPGRLRAAVRKTLLALSLVGFPLFATLAVLGDPVIRVMYGPKWLAAIVPFQLLCLAGPGRMLANVLGAAMNAGGQVAVEVRRRAVILVLLAVGSWAGTPWGLPGVAAAVAAVNWLSAAALATVATRVMPFTLPDILRPQRVALIATLGLAATEYALFNWVGSSWNHVVRAIVAGIAGALVYVAIAWVMADRPLRDLAAELVADARGLKRRARPGEVTS